MGGNVNRLWVKALKGNARAYRHLGILFLKGKGCKRDKRLAKQCLKKAIEAGDEPGYLLYHRLFSRGMQVIDDASYLQIYQEFETAGNQKVKKRFGLYLALGTKRQRSLVKYHGQGLSEKIGPSDGRDTESPPGKQGTADGAVCAT